MAPKDLTWSSLKVGIVVLIGLAIFIFMVVVVGTEQNIFASKYKLRVFLPNAQGLVNGAMVSLGGLKVGFVGDLKFAERESVNGVDVTLNVLTQYRSSITRTSLAQIKTIGLLGDKYIDISLGSQNEQPLPEGSYVEVRESFDIETFGPQFRTAWGDFVDLLGNMKVIAASIERGEGSVGRLIRQPDAAENIERFLASLNTTMTAVGRGRGLLGAMVYNDSLARSVSDISANLQAVTTQLRQGKGTMGKLIMEDRLYTNLAAMSGRADSLMAKANSDSSNVSRLIGDPNFYTQLLGLMRDLNLLLVDIKEHPERYLNVSVF